MIKISLVEDEDNLVELIRDNLELEGYAVEVYKHGGEALRQVQHLIKSRLVILDVMLPEVDGIEICKAIRQHSDVPVLFLSAKGTTADRIAGLRSGGNDYLPKPFDLEELLLRVKVLCAAGTDIDKTKLVIGTKEIDFTSFEVVDLKTQTVVQQLSKKEIELLRLFSENENKVISRDLILDEVWGSDAFPTSRTIDNFILHFRKLFEEDPKQPRFFHSVRGVGYRFSLHND